MKNTVIVRSKDDENLKTFSFPSLKKEKYGKKTCRDGVRYSCMDDSKNFPPVATPTLSLINTPPTFEVILKFL